VVSFTPVFSQSGSEISVIWQLGKYNITASCEIRANKPSNHSKEGRGACSNIR